MDNGIKFFDAHGRKLPDEAELAIEEEVQAWSERPMRIGGRTGSRRPTHARGAVRPITGALEDYMRELESRFQPALEGTRILLDCANGATHRAAPLLFERLGRTSRRSPASPTGSTSTPASAPPTWRRSWSGCARAATRSASRSTATETACWPSARTARSSTETS